MGSHDTAQICLNGHVANDATQRHPEFSKPFCDRCGEKTITACEHCRGAIRGEFHVPGIIIGGGPDYHPPAFCLNCGRAFPWTERKSQAAIELFLEESMSPEEKEEFKTSIEQIAKDTPQAQVASKRITRLLGKVATHTATAIRDILVDVASETAKKILFPTT